MSYLITNQSTNLKLVLSTNQSNYSQIRLHTYINDETDVYRTYTPSLTSTDDGYDLTFNIYTKDYQVDDIITKFELFLNSSTHLWQTNEGITWLLDGNEYSTKHTNSETFQFDNQGSHTIEAVFVGNDSLETSSTGKQPLLISQPPIDTSGSLSNDGAFDLRFVNPNLSKITYDDKSKIEFILTKGGVPVSTIDGHRQVIDIITPTRIATTDLYDGKASVKNTSEWDAGTYEFGAYYQIAGAGTIVRTPNRKITIEKGQPVFTDNYDSAGDFVPKSKYKLILKFGNTLLSNTKITLYVKGKATTLTTNKWGVAYYGFESTGTYTFKAVFKGNKNLKPCELSRTITVVKNNG